MLDSYYDVTVPDELKEVASRHQQHVTELVSMLRIAGTDSSLIELSVDQLITSYRAELLRAITALKGLPRG